jgi:hypothetical protein
VLFQWQARVNARDFEGGTKMATKKNAKSGTRGKKLARAKQMKEVKPLAVNAYLYVDGVNAPKPE